MSDRVIILYILERRSFKGMILIADFPEIAPDAVLLDQRCKNETGAFVKEDVSDVCDVFCSLLFQM